MHRDEGKEGIEKRSERNRLSIKVIDFVLLETNNGKSEHEVVTDIRGDSRNEEKPDQRMIEQRCNAVVSDHMGA